MNWDDIILERWKAGYTIDEITIITPFDVSYISSTIRIAMKNGLL